MHRFHSKSIIRRLRLAAFLFCMKCVLAVAALSLLVWSLLVDDSQMTAISISLGALAIFCVITQWLLASRGLCPLCMTPVLASKACSKHRNARSLLGSHRLRVALAILFKGSFTCPYCHESSVLEMRDRSRMNYRSDSRD
jgi:hypothetical protein